MRYLIKNIGKGNYFCTEAGRLLGPGDSVRVNRVDEGTRRNAATGKDQLLEIIDTLIAPMAVAELAPAPTPVPPPPPAPEPEKVAEPEPETEKPAEPAPPEDNKGRRRGK